MPSVQMLRCVSLSPTCHLTDAAESKIPAGEVDCQLEKGFQDLKSRGMEALPQGACADPG